MTWKLADGLERQISTSHRHTWIAMGEEQELTIWEVEGPTGIIHMVVRFEDGRDLMAADCLLALVSQREIEGYRLISMDATSAVMRRVEPLK